jgi:flagellar protein FlaJ
VDSWKAAQARDTFGCGFDPIEDLVSASVMMRPAEEGFGVDRRLVAFQFTHQKLCEQVLLREKRSTISMGFVVLLIPMHALMVSIFLFLFHILITMSNAIQNVIGSLGPTGSGAFGAGSVSGALGGGMNLFVSFPEGEMTVYVIIMITILAVANILASKIVMGGDRYIFYFFASIILAITGIIYIAAPILVSTFFAIPTFAGV